MLDLISHAATLAVPRNIETDHRAFWLAAVGIRGDGVMVTARNGSVMSNDSYEKGWTFPSAHAEARVCRKMNYGGTVYVARVSRDGHLAMSKPCFSCMMALKSRSVERVFYSINDSEYGCIDLRI